VGTERTLAEVTAGVGAAIAAYTHALDDGRTDDIVVLFCSDGSCDMPGLGRHVGHDALREAYARVVPVTPQRHLVLNTYVEKWDNDEASTTSDVVLLVKGGDRWSVRLVGRYHDILHFDGDAWRFHSRVAEFIA
jgi:SnoaL-like domain